MPRPVGRPPGGRATVNQNHPAATAAAARVAAAGKIIGEKNPAHTSRDSPSCAAKTLANKKISEICHHNPRIAVAVEAPDDAPATVGVTVVLPEVSVAGVPVLDAVPPAEIPLAATLPPLWNAWCVGHEPPCISSVTVGS